MKTLYCKSLFAFVGLFLLFSGCKKDNRGLNLFSIEQDKKLGAQMDQYIRDSSGYVLLDEAKYPVMYDYINNIKKQILASSDIKYKTEFPWKVTIIQDDKTLNAFATPGGYIFIYTGLIKYLECGDHLAGVLGHEMAHADRRHSTQQMTDAYGVDFLIKIVLGQNPGKIGAITQNLIGLKFSRGHESEADEFSVRYLCGADNTAADGAAGFFEKLIATGQTSATPEFLSTHPNPDNRVADIKSTAKTLGCNNTTPTCSSAYTQAKSTLP